MCLVLGKGVMAQSYYCVSVIDKIGMSSWPIRLSQVRFLAGSEVIVNLFGTGIYGDEYWYVGLLQYEYSTVRIQYVGPLQYEYVPRNFDYNPTAKTQVKQIIYNPYQTKFSVLHSDQ